VAPGDPALVERVAGNLVENALRHGAPGAPVRVTGHRDGAGGVLLRVANAGRPLDPGLLDRLTEPFWRAGRRHDGGAGLGLSIVRAAVEAHGGRLELAAPATGGLVADVRLPAAARVTGR
jgi:signal transduction histidine kinase